MILLATVILAIFQAGISSGPDEWDLRIEFNEQEQIVVVSVEATNTTNNSVGICPGWGFGIRYKSDEMDEYSICEALVYEEVRMLKLGAQRETKFSISGSYSAGSLYEGQPVDLEEQLILAPGETISDSLSIHLKKEAFIPCPGEIELLYRLNFCGLTNGVLSVFPPIGEESAVVGKVHVP
jgi:hypothetical protein